MAFNSIDPFSFTRGIESVIYEEISAQEKLPENSLFAPSDEHIERHVDKLFESNSINEQILKSLKPDVSDKTIQAPVKYHQMIGSIHDFLHNAANNPSFSENKDVLNNSIGLFQEEKGLFELLSMYRNLLHKA
jgi:hypothetical protein